MSAEQKIVESFHNAAIGLRPNTEIESDRDLSARFAPWVYLGNLLNQYLPKEPNDQRILIPRKNRTNKQDYSIFYTADEGVDFFGCVYSRALSNPKNIVGGKAVTGPTFDIYGNDAEVELKDMYAVPLENDQVPDAVFKPFWTALSACAWKPLPNGARNPRLLRQEGHLVRSAIYANVPPELERRLMNIINAKPDDSTARTVLEWMAKGQLKYQTGETKYPTNP